MIQNIIRKNTDNQNHGSAQVHGQNIPPRFGITRQECRAGDKPSTWSPPGTREAGNHILRYCFTRLHGDAYHSEDSVKIEFHLFFCEFPIFVCLQNVGVEKHLIKLGS